MRLMGKSKILTIGNEFDLTGLVLKDLTNGNNGLWFLDCDRHFV
jgi:hypothetical protein